MPIISREIALNTRKEGGSGPDYKLVQLLAILRKVSAVILWVMGIVVGILGIIAGNSLDGFF